MALKTQLVPNVPLRIDVRFCEVVRGEHAIDIKFKGRQPETGEDVILYLRHDPALDALAQANVLGPLPTYSIQQLPETGVRLNLKVTRLTFLADQPAGRGRSRLLIATWSPDAVQTSAPPAEAPSRPPVEERREGAGLRRGRDYLMVMEFVASVAVPEFERLHGHAPDDAAIARMQQALFLQHCRDADDDRRRPR